MFIDRYYEYQVREKANIIFEKVDTGIYKIAKNRFQYHHSSNGELSKDYVNTSNVLDALNKLAGVMVIKGKGQYDCHVNFDVDYSKLK